MKVRTLSVIDDVFFFFYIIVVTANLLFFMYLSVLSLSMLEKC